MTADIGNAVFELVGAILAWMNVLQLYKDRKVAGVYWPVTAFFGVWGLWNLYYYSSLGQWFSWSAGIFLCSANLLWACMAWRFSR